MFKVSIENKILFANQYSKTCLHYFFIWKNQFVALPFALLMALQIFIKVLSPVLVLHLFQHIPKVGNLDDLLMMKHAFSQSPTDCSNSAVVQIYCELPEVSTGTNLSLEIVSLLPCSAVHE